MYSKNSPSSNTIFANRATFLLLCPAGSRFGRTLVHNIFTITVGLAVAAERLFEGPLTEEIQCADYRRIINTAARKKNNAAVESFTRPRRFSMKREKTLDVTPKRPSRNTTIKGTINARLYKIR